MYYCPGSDYQCQFQEKDWDQEENYWKSRCCFLHSHKKGEEVGRHDRINLYYTLKIKYPLLFVWRTCMYKNMYRAIAVHQDFVHVYIYIVDIVIYDTICTKTDSVTDSNLTSWCLRLNSNCITLIVVIIPTRWSWCIVYCV